MKGAHPKKHPLATPRHEGAYNWLPDRDSNPDKQIQSLLSYH